MSDESFEKMKKILAPAFKKKTNKTKIPMKELLSTGSTMLNLACSGKADGGFAMGGYYFLVGDSSSGKTFLALTCFAEASINPNFDEYELIHDDAENGAMMDFGKFFGKKCAERVSPPRRDKQGNPVFSVTTDDFYDNLLELIAQKKRFIYVLDSMDVLGTNEDNAKEEANRLARKKSREGKSATEKGTYGTSKAKANSTRLRGIVHALKETGSILIIIAQTRDNIDPMSFDKKTRGGGHSLKFYAHLELWSSVKGPIKKRIKDKDRIQGIYSQVRIKKNRLTGRDRKIVIPIYNSIGFDDIGGCINYLLEEGHWKKGKAGIDAKELDFVGSRDALIAHIEQTENEDVLRATVQEVWDGIEDALAVVRKNKYV